VTSVDVLVLLVGLLDCLNLVVTYTQIHRNLDVLYSKVVGWKAKEDDLANHVLAHDNAGNLLQAAFSLPFTIDWNTKGIKKCQHWKDTTFHRRHSTSGPQQGINTLQLGSANHDVPAGRSSPLTSGWSHHASDRGHGMSLPRSSRHIIELNNSPVVQHAKSRKQQQAEQVRRAIALWGINTLQIGAEFASSTMLTEYLDKNSTMWHKIPSTCLP
jgi:hypothetical protein